VAAVPPGREVALAIGDDGGFSGGAAMVTSPFWRELETAAFPRPGESAT
jgi:hypothetical protein